ncbi:hypothetical protein KC346_g1614, partial [Hortaea werneckii]
GSAFDETLKASEDEDPDDAGLRPRQGGEFERRIAEQKDLPEVMAKCVRDTVWWPATSQSVKSAFTAGISRSWRYYGEKRKKGKTKPAAPAASEAEKKKEE